MKKLLLVALLFALGCGIAGLIILKRPAPEYTTSAPAKPAIHTAPAPSPRKALPILPPEQPPPAVSAPPPSAPAAQSVQASPAPKAQSSAPRGAPGGKPPKEPLKDPLARDAMALVGVDPLAEQYWCAAINDPDLSAHERQDLIEDLNEEGLSDPKNPAPEDLPVILSRLQIIEQNAPYAMDQVNVDAFQEAYKDLVNLANRVLGGGQPVR